MKELEPAGEIVPGQFLGIDAPADKARFAVLLLPFARGLERRQVRHAQPAPRRPTPRPMAGEVSNEVPESPSIT